MSYFADINQFANSVNERIAHHKELAQNLSDSKVQDIQDQYNTLQGVIQSGAGVSAGIGGAITLGKKVVQMRAARAGGSGGSGDGAPDAPGDSGPADAPTADTPSAQQAVMDADPEAGAVEGAGGAADISSGIAEGAETAASTGSKALGVLGDVAEGIGDFLDPAALVVSAGLGLASLFEDIFGKKHASAQEEESAAETTPSQITAGGTDPGAMVAASQ